MQLRYLQFTSIGMIVLGILAVASATFLNVDPVWMLLGIMLLLGGVVKVVSLLIWTRIAKLGTDEHAPIDAG
jgi:uncharacterized membrane protein HdeD (DUF308 family)